MEEIKKQWFGSGHFDPINSTFKNEIYCKSGKKLIGFSKGKFTNEGKDKIVLLEKWIIRLCNKGYFDSERIERIDFYLKSFLSNNDELIFTLYPNNFSMGFNEKFSMNERLISFFKNFYSQLEKKDIEIKTLIHKPIKLSEQQMFNTNTKFLSNEIELMEYVITKKREGIEPGLLLGFAQKYREKYF